MEGMLGREHNPHPSELLKDQQGAHEWMKNLRCLRASDRFENHTDHLCALVTNA
jgi:hypothetical protein